MTTRRVNVFARADGTVLHDVLHRTPEPSTPPTTPPPSASQICAQTIWPIVHNFIALSRELDRTASLRRLVFRNPQHYAPAVSNFRTAVRPDVNHTPPVVIHCLQRAPFVVTVTETLPNYTLFDHDHTHSPSASSSTYFTLSDFCDTIMHFVHKEYHAFLAAHGAASHSDAHMSVVDAQSNTNGSVNDGNDNDSHNNKYSHADQTVQTLKQVIQQSELTEMIHNTMQLVEL